MKNEIVNKQHANKCLKVETYIYIYKVLCKCEKLQDIILWSLSKKENIIEKWNLRDKHTRQRL